MKHINLIFLFIINLSIQGQSKFQTVFNTDSLSGFNEMTAKSQALRENMFGKEFNSYMARAKRNFINSKYTIVPANQNAFNQRFVGNTGNQVMAVCTNMDFETGNLTGWTQGNGSNTNSNTMGGCCPSAGGNAAMINGGTDALTGVSLVSPLGGTWVCKVNNQTTGGYTDRISQTFNVTAANSLVQFAYLAVLQSAGHACIDQPYMNIRLLDCSNNIIACPQVDIQEGAGCGTATGFVTGPGYSYTNAWQVSALDLTPYIGSCITIQVTAGACTQGGHWGYGYFDAKCLPMNITVNNTPFPVGTSATTVALCGSLTATVSAPPSLGPYTWNGPAGSGVTNVHNQTFTTTTAGLYTLSMNPVGACAPIVRTVFLQVSMPPLANFSFTNMPCTNTANFSSTSTLNGGAPITGYQWTWGDGSPNTTTSSSPHTYTLSGPKTIKLVVTNSAGCMDSISYTINISQKPTANFNVNPLCFNSVNNFTNTSTTLSGTNSYTWDYGNASPVSNATSPAYTYPAPGNYTVSLLVNNTDGCKDSIKKPLTVYALPLANFTLNYVPCGSTSFTATSTSSLNGGSAINSYVYSWNDATPNSLIDPAPHTYLTSGPKQIKLLITNANGCKDSITKNITIAQKPTANFTINPVCFNSISNFTNTSTTPSGTNSYTWDYGNASPVSNAASPAYTYPVPGNYTVSLIINNTDGCMDSIKKPLAIYALPLANFTVNYVPCGSTSFTATSTSSLNSGSPINNYVYSWNDATPNSLADPAPHTYTTSGPKQIKLLITNANGCKDSITKSITIAQKPMASFTVNPICLGANNNFINSSTTPSGILSYTWNFGNASALNNSANPSYTYPASGNYTALLFISNTDNCFDSISKPVSVYGRAVVDFTPTGVCFGAASNFTNLTSTVVNANTGAIATASWSFGNGGTSTLQNPVYTYTNPANQTANTIYTVNLYITTVNGCKDSITKPVTVYSMPTVNFTADSVCFGTPTTLSDMSNTNGNPLFLNAWDFNGDNVADMTNNASSSVTTFTNWGNTAVTYTVYSTPNGGLLTCKDQVTKNVWVHPLPSAAITYTNKCIDAQPNLMSGVTSTLAVGTISNYAWNYGNGNNNLINPLSASSFSYNLSGNYMITLTVTSAAGCTNVATQGIEVWERPYANFSYSKACAGKRITLKSNQLPNSAPIVTFDWDLNNTLPSVEATGAEVSYTYAAGGPQAINLLITSNHGCKNVAPGNIYVNYNPKPNFYAPKRAGCADLCIPILDSTQAVPLPAKNTDWEWDFGNQMGNVTNQSQTQHACFSNTSNLILKDYDLKLIVRTDSGCVDSITKIRYVRVYPNPKADFEWTGKNGDLLTPFIAFENTSVGYNRFAWYYNDGVNITDSTNQNPTHYYNTDIPRTFNVFLAVRNQYGCKDTISKYVEIGPEYTFYIPNTFTPDADGINETFTGTGIGIKGFKMWIYDRWGEKLFYTEDIKTGWDGTIKGKQGKEKVDVYTYRALVKDLWNKEHEYVGHVTLLK